MHVYSEVYFMVPSGVCSLVSMSRVTVLVLLFQETSDSGHHQPLNCLIPGSHVLWILRLQAMLCYPMLSKEGS